MKKFALLALLAAALAVPSIAAATATPQGKLTGSATITPNGVNTFTFAIGTAVIDGGTSYVGAENDLSGNCDGDSGTVDVGGFTANIVCAHYVASSGCCTAGSPKMRLAYETRAPGLFVVARITDNGASTDTIALGNTGSLAFAKAWVNRGFQGGHVADSLGWSYYTVTAGGWTITASQT
jgi:hypothetical protein